ncbi:glutaminase A [Natranaerobius trueperi]|uniref:glutaminase A n=1 Tax=Natranaerobius trueperi TaxID=759412 RepID=UPI001F0B27CB|nr:glutaminase A [Natranaerobius trueperi]
MLDELIEKHRPLCQQGSLPSYIPALTNPQQHLAGISIIDIKGSRYNSGDYLLPFTIQSISKIITLTMAILDQGEDFVFSRVGAEPTEDKFNSILPLEISSAYPPNPMINAGAIVVTSLINGKTSQEKMDRILNFTRKLANNPEISVNEEVFISERRTGNKNISLAYYLKDANVLLGEVEDVLDTYFRHCSISLTASDLANIALVYSQDGKSLTGEQLIPPMVCRQVRTIMAMSGFYDESGRFARRVGIPAKSGVGGGILGVVPNRMGIGFYGPSLNTKGTSIVGFDVLEELIEKLDLSIY